VAKDSDGHYKVLKPNDGAGDDPHVLFKVQRYHEVFAVERMNTTDEGWSTIVERYAGSWEIGKLSKHGNPMPALSLQEQGLEDKAALEAFDVGIFIGELVVNRETA